LDGALCIVAQIDDDLTGMAAGSAEIEARPANLEHRSIVQLEGTRCAFETIFEATRGWQAQCRVADWQSARQIKPRSIKREIQVRRLHATGHGKRACRYMRRIMADCGTRQAKRLLLRCIRGRCAGSQSLSRRASILARLFHTLSPRMGN
jgi:hypothetical protein